MSVVGYGFNKRFQTEANVKSMGGGAEKPDGSRTYFTDPQHCEWLGNFFKFSEEEETCVLEPCAGNGMAVKLVTGVNLNPKVRNFAVEINADSVAGLEEDGTFEAVVKADFLSGTIITPGSFTFCFFNPPYMEQSNYDRSRGMKAERTEKLFTERVANCMKAGGYAVCVIPHRVFVDDVFMSFWMSRFETVVVYKFHESEFKKWGQVAIIGKRRSGNLGIYKEARIAMQERCKLENLDLLPTEWPKEKRIEVPTSSAAAVENFRTKVFDKASAQRYVEKNPAVLSALKSAIASKTGVKEYSSSGTFTPPKKLSFANLALLTACGIGSGYAGSVEEENLHLQRGSVEVKLTERVDQKKGEVVVKKSNITNIVLIESDGTITDLVKQEGDVIDDEEGI